MTRFLGTVCGVALALLIMLLGERIGSALFPITISTEVVDDPTGMPSEIKVRFGVPLEALIAHVTTGALAAFFGAQLAAFLSHRTALSAWFVGGSLAAAQLAFMAGMPNHLAFVPRVLAATVCLAAAWLGAKLAMFLSRRT